jgi:hypothetical protein
MPLLLADAARLSQDMLLRGVVETVIQESAVLRYLPFVQIVGNSLRYNREVTLGDVQFYSVGDTWDESALTTTEQTATLAILGGDADVDAFLQQTYSNPNDLRALVIAAKAKSLAHKFNQTFFQGDSAVNPEEFDGLKKLAAGARTVNQGPNGAELTLDHLDELVDMLKPGAPHTLFMSRKTRRKLSSLRRASGSVLETTADALGRRVISYDGIPVEVDDSIPDNETLGTSTDCSSIYAVQFGFQTGVCGLDNGGIQAQPLGALETKDAWRTRIKWYCGLALFRDTALARLEGVRV